MLAHKPKAHGTSVTASRSLSRPRVHVVGAGAMGARHVRVFAAAGADVTVEDADAARALDVAERFGARATSAIADGATVDLVVVATPTLTHADVASEAFSLGANVLVEKPLAVTLAAAERLATRAIAAHRFLFVGMSERFHPVIRALRARVNPADVTRLTFHRFGASSSLQPALLNLGVHDVDLALHFTRAELRVASARSLAHDAAFVHLSGGLDREQRERHELDVSIAAGAASPRDRRMTLDLASGERFEGNLLDPALTRFASRSSEGEAVPLSHDEPLALQAEAVLRAIAGGDAGALASAADGVRVLRLVEAASRLLLRAPSADSSAIELTEKL